MSEDLYEYDSEGTDGSDAVIEISDLDETLPPSDKETQPPLEKCGQEVEWSQSPLGYFDYYFYIPAYGYRRLRKQCRQMSVQSRRGSSK
ncbi:hypothetical protein DPMN_068233 [Dreissena polymorpha]|uniref:Uncharacterized protein n=1 Tax=Dreissena polymorpha TaxID=45954 RepID=A0A9D3YZG5_DREPO|nr:hypothetical protein DPMN_068233 [Dreissena polymorpha]